MPTSPLQRVARGIIIANVCVVILPIALLADLYVIVLLHCGCSMRLSRRVAWAAVAATIFYISVLFLGWNTLRIAAQNCAELVVFPIPAILSELLLSMMSIISASACISRICLQAVVHIAALMQQFPLISIWILCILLAAVWA